MKKIVQMPTHLGHLIRPKRIGGFRGGGLPGIHLQQIMSLWLAFSSSLSCHCHNCCHCLCLCRCYCYSTLKHNCHVQVHCHCHNRCHCLYCYARRGQCDSKKKKTQRTELTDVTAETAMFWVCPHTWQRYYLILWFVSIHLSILRIIHILVLLVWFKTHLPMQTLELICVVAPLCRFLISKSSSINSQGHLKWKKRRLAK